MKFKPFTAPFSTTKSASGKQSGTQQVQHQLPMHFKQKHCPLLLNCNSVYGQKKLAGHDLAH